MNRAIAIIGIATAVVGVALFILIGQSGQRRLFLPFSRNAQERVQRAYVAIGNTNVQATVAASEKQRQQGLSGRTSLGELQGMLFVFGQPGRHSFWMQGMRFPIDIIWIRDGVVVELLTDVPVPTGVPPVYTPEQEATSALEVNAGFVAKHKIRVGSPAETTFDGYVDE